METLLTKEQILAAAEPLVIRKGLYFLLLEGEIVYVGQSSAVEERIAIAAKTDKEFDSYMVLHCDDLTTAQMLEKQADYIVRYKVSTHVSMFYAYQLPLPRLTAGNPYFDAIVPRAARLTCTTPAFAALWQEVIGEPWDNTKGATDPAERQQLRHELDALVAHLYGLTRADFAHILATFPLVFPPTPEGQHKQEALLAEFERWAGLVAEWARG
jgi:hypothetical protein